MNKRAPLITLAVMAAAALPAAHADAKKLPTTAHFKVRVTAAQVISWNENIEVHGSMGGCDGIVDQLGNGTSGLELHSDGWKNIVVKRAHGQVSFDFGHGKPDFQALGHLERDGVSDTKQVKAPSNPLACPKSGTPSAPDCGERGLPPGARVGLEWNTPANWPDVEGPTPLAPSLVLIGPYSRDPLEMRKAMAFNNCPGVGSDWMLGANTSEGYDTGAAGLPLSKLFGKKKSFEVSRRLKRTANSPLPRGVTGSYPVSTALRWKVQFQRVSKPHRG